MYFKYRNTLHTPQKCKKVAEIKNIPYFLPVVNILEFNKTRRILMLFERPLKSTKCNTTIGSNENI